MAGSSRRMSLKDTTSYVRQIRDDIDRLKTGYQGLNGRGDQKVPYIPLRALIRFWKPHKITRVLEDCGIPSCCKPSVIRQNFLRIFSFLVYEGFVTHFDLFIKSDLNDSRFPLHDFPASWADRAYYAELFKSISEKQWMFFPVLFTKDALYNQMFGPDYILPIDDEKIIKSDVGITVYKIKTNPCCTNFDGPSKRADSCPALHSQRPSHDTEASQTTFVRKSYRGDASKKFFDRECRAFNSLQQDPNPYIVACYGTFTQERSDGSLNYNLILEYIDGGDLAQYYKEASPPRTTNGVIGFWKSFLDPLKGLRLFESHNVHSNKKGYQVIHQDIKPENFLIKCSSANPGHVLVIADLGFSHTTVKPEDADSQDTSGIDFHGGQTYGAPENSHHARHTHRGKNYITPEADIFSMGCVMSDAASWLTGGRPRREEYWNNRKAEIKKIRTFRDSGHDGCFHNGIQRLEAVVEMHEEIRNTVEPFDTVTPHVVNMIEDHMLLRQRQGRWTPNQLHEELSKIIQDAESALEASLNQQSENGPETPIREKKHRSDSTIASNSPSIFERLSPVSNSPTSPPYLAISTESTVIRPHHQPNGSIATADAREIIDGIPSPKLSYEQALAYWKAKKNGQNLDPVVHGLILELKNHLRQRDHLFFIDTSRTMGEHIKEVHEAFGVFSYLAKLIDTNGIEVSFSSAPRKVYNDTRTSRLKEKLQGQTWNQIAFEDRFSEFIDYTVISRLPSGNFPRIYGRSRKPLSIFVFTDGRWGDDTDKACGIENPVKRLVDKIKAKELSRTQVVFQFVRFGDDEAGIRHLKYLDEFGKESSCDVVDTKPVHGDVFALFVGAIDPVFDEERSSSSIQSPSAT